MEKVVLSKGYEFELVTDGIVARDNYITVKFVPGEYTVEQLLAMWKGNSTIQVKLDETAVREFKGFMTCSEVTLTPDYLISTKFVCPECETEVGPHFVNCPNCNASFEHPKMIERRGTVCTVKCSIPDINARMSDAEESIEDIINEILGR